MAESRKEGRRREGGKRGEGVPYSGTAWRDGLSGAGMEVEAEKRFAIKKNKKETCRNITSKQLNTARDNRRLYYKSYEIFLFLSL